VTFLAAACLATLQAGDLRGQNGVVFDFLLGYKSMSGDLGGIVDAGVVAEFDFAYQKNAFRYGIAINLVSLDVVEPHQEESVSQVGLSLFATWLIKRESRVLPYLQLRAGTVRYRPEGETFEPQEPAAEQEEGENVADPVTGFEGGLTGGFEFAVSPKFAIDLSAVFSYIITEAVDLSAIGLEPADKGTAWSIRIGTRWNP
jgi:hypothetical protein